MGEMPWGIAKIQLRLVNGSDADASPPFTLASVSPRLALQVPT